MELVICTGCAQSVHSIRACCGDVAIFNTTPSHRMDMDDVRRILSPDLCSHALAILSLTSEAPLSLAFCGTSH